MKIIRLATTIVILAIVVTASAQRKAQSGIFGAGQPGEVSVVRMEAKKLGLKNFEMESRQLDGRLAIDAFTANLGSGTMQGRGLIDWSRPDEMQRMTIQVQNVEAMTLLNAFSVKLDAQIVSQGNAVIETQWRGVRGALPRQTMNGTVRLQLGPGRITNAEVLQKVASYTGIAELQQLEFQTANLEGTIRDGVMSITKAEVNGAHASAEGIGIMDLRTEQVRLKFDCYVSPAMLQRSNLPQVRALGTAASVTGGESLIKIPLPVIMSGQIRDPEFTLTWETGNTKK